MAVNQMPVPNWFTQGSLPPGAPSPIGQALTMPAIPTGVADPSKVGLWQQFRQKLANDPNLRMAMLMSGANMMRTPKMGETGFDVFADAAQTGFGTLDTLRQRDRSQRLDEQDRTNTAEFRRSQLAQGDKRIGIQEDHLAEMVRQFDAKLEAGYFDPKQGARGGINSTGPERMADLAYQAFITSGLYPDTEQGQALARLRSQGLIGKNLVNPQDRFSYMTELAKELALFNPELSSEQIAAKAEELTGILAERANANDPATPKPQHNPNYIGQAAANPSNPAQAGQIVESGDEAKPYRIEYPDGTISGNLDESQVILAISAAVRQGRE